MTQRNLTTRRNARGAAMVETVFLLPFIMVVVVLLIYLGWNFRRMAQVTNMDRYVVWQQVTPGASGPSVQARDEEMRNPRLNNAFFGLHGDGAEALDELMRSGGYTPEGHERMRDMQADETFSYFDAFIDSNPRAIREQFEAEHEHITDMLQEMGMSDMTRNFPGHVRLNGDWRYANGVRFDRQRGEWEPGGYRVSPGESMRDVFFAEIDSGLEGYDEGGNNLAGAIRDFYLRYPAYLGPDVKNDSRSRNVPNAGRGGPAAGL